MPFVRIECSKQAADAIGRLSENGKLADLVNEELDNSHHGDCLVEQYAVVEYGPKYVDVTLASA